MRVIRKKYVLTICSLLLVGGLCGCSDKNKINYDTIENAFKDARNELNDVITNNSYVNLDLESSDLNCPENITELYNIVMHEESIHEYENDDFYNKFLNQLEFFFPNETVDEQRINVQVEWSDESDVDVVHNDFGIPYIDNRDMLNSGKGRLTMLDYRGDSVYLCCNNNKTLNPQRMNNGATTRMFVDMSEYENAPDFYLGTWSDSQYPKAEYTYLNNGMHDSEEYELLYGRTSVGEAVDFFENKYCPRLPFTYSNDIGVEVDSIKVIPLEDGKYCYMLTLTLSYNGIKFDAGPNTAVMENPMPGMIFTYITAEAVMTGPETVDFVMFPYGKDVENNSESIEKIIHLKDALMITSEALSDSVVFDVENISFVYRLTKEEDLYTENEDTFLPIYGTAAWRIDVKNPNDGKNYLVYVQADNGAVTYYVRW